MEKFTPKKRGLLWAGLAIGTTLLSSCGLKFPNNSGEGNEFTLKAKIENVGKQSVTVEVLEEIKADGWSSEGWFDVGDSRQIHDNCDCHGAFNGNKKYGEVYGQAGELIDIAQLAVGECLFIEGKVRSDDDGKYSHERAVFDNAQVVPC